VPVATRVFEARMVAAWVVEMFPVTAVALIGMRAGWW
jgi:hypothetical protein